MGGADAGIDTEAARARLAGSVAVASLAYVRDNIGISRADGDLLTPFLFTAILDANMAPVNRDPGLRLLYGGVEDSCPDDLRRPVSINAVAQSLRIPFETARRRVGALARSGDCVITPRGVYVPHSAVTSAAYVAIQIARYERARDFYWTLREAEVLPVEAAVSPPPAEPLVRAVNRAISEYMLRACADLIGLTGDILSSFILLETALDNIADLPAGALAAWTRDPEALGGRVRSSALGARLRVSAETLRRHALALEAAGLCRRRSAGLVATAPPSLRPHLAHLVETNLANVQRLFARLRELGVTGGWQVEDGLTREPGGRRLAL